MLSSFKDTPFIDIHTHGQHTRGPEWLQVRNIFYQDGQQETDPDHHYTIGLHPWHTNGFTFDKDHFTTLVSRENIIGIGEIGLDRLKGTDLEHQIQLFLDQALTADKFSKPVIIHCVKSWDELIAVKKIAHPKVPWIIHGFRGKKELTNQMIRHGFYLSYGESLLDERDRIEEGFKAAPMDRILLETDDSNYTIQEIYTQAASILGIPVSELKVYLAENFERIFGLYGSPGMDASN